MRRITGSAAPRVGTKVGRVLAPLSLLALLIPACGGPRGSAAGSGASGVEMRAAEDHPKLGLVARQGDPFAGVAVAVAHDLGSSASLWLGSVVARRIERATHRPTPATPTGNGFVIDAAAETADDGARFVAAASEALTTPIGEEDLTYARALVQASASARLWATTAEAAVAACDGELGARAPASAPSASELERWRDRARSAASVAFAAVGPRAVLEAAATALHATPAWPSRSLLDDPWPASDVSGYGPSIASGESLSIAIRTGDGEAALLAAAEVGARGSALGAHVLALDPHWTIDRVVGTLRPRGACLRVDLSSTESTSPASRSAADVAALVLDEASRALAEPISGTRVRDQAVLGETDPRQAAAIAAWHALSGQLPPTSSRTLVSYSRARGASEDDGGFSRALGQARAARTEPSVDVLRASEAGQGEAWLLLASPCATYRESGDGAGVTALSMRALASAVPEIDGVRIEPWVSNDGIGLLAHGPRRDAAETPAHHAERVAGALGRALAATPLSDAVTAAARLRATSELSAELDPLWPVALEALAPKHPSLLDPRGTWQSVSEASVHAVETARRTILRGPLRLAALLDDADPGASRGAELELGRWLRPERTERSTCPASPQVQARTGEYVVPAASSDGGSSRALLAVALPPGPGVPPEAEATAHLLNRANGWLDTSVRVPGLAVFAEASVLGGSDGSALVVELTTTEHKAKEAIAQVRALFQRLQEGAATADDVVLVRAAAEDAASRSAADPRHRLVRLWTGRADAKPVDLASLRRFHHQALGPDHHVVVVTRPRP